MKPLGSNRILLHFNPVTTGLVTGCSKLTTAEVRIQTRKEMTSQDTGEGHTKKWEKNKNRKYEVR